MLKQPFGQLHGIKVFASLKRLLIYKMYVLLCLEAYMLSQLSGIVLHSVCHVF